MRSLSAAFALRAGLFAAPTVALLQARALAPLATVVLACAVLAHARAHRRLPWPRGAGGAAAACAVVLCGWGAATAAWSVDPGRSLFEAARIGGLVLLGAGAAAAVAADTVAARLAMARALLWGMAIGLPLAAADALSGHALRAAARGLAEATPRILYGAKPTASVLGLLVPLLACMPGLSRLARAGLVAAGLAAVLVLPGEAAKLAGVAGVLGLLAGHAAPRLAPRALAGGLAVLVLMLPTLLGAAFAHDVPAGRLPPSAAHRLLIWDFTLDRIAERPLLGWGMEASRAIPGGQSSPDRAMLVRFGLTSAASQAWFLRPGGVTLLPLHPHNWALQIWLELGLVGAALAGAGLWLLGVAAARGPVPALATGVLAAGAVSASLSYGAWQSWWVATLLLAAVACAGWPGGSSARTAASASAMGISAMSRPP